MTQEGKWVQDIDDVDLNVFCLTTAAYLANTLAMIVL